MLLHFQKRSRDENLYSFWNCDYLYSSNYFSKILSLLRILLDKFSYNFHSFSLCFLKIAAFIRISFVVSRHFKFLREHSNHAIQKITTSSSLSSTPLKGRTSSMGSYFSKNDQICTSTTPEPPQDPKATTTKPHKSFSLEATKAVENGEPSIISLKIFHQFT